jgi:APA family basic amino acid/polyamine antiporter
MASQTELQKAGLVRGLTLIGAISVVVGTVIGTGVFLKARIMTCNVGSPLIVIGIWFAAGLLSLAGALTYAELAAMMPEAGGEYLFIRNAYGSAMGFVYGWTQFVIVYTASAAAKGVGFALFLNVLTGGALEPKYFVFDFFGHPVVFGRLQIVALSIVSLVTLINCAAVSVSGKIASFLTGLKVLLVISVGLGAFFLARGNWANFHLSNMGGTCEGVSASARGGLLGFGAAMLGALWAYDGWSNLTIVAGEVKNPQRNLPLALIGGMICIAFLYMFVNIAYFYVLTPTEVASVSTASSVATDVVKRFLGPFATSLMACGLLISSLGSLYTGILTGARIPFAMSRDRLFFRALGEISPRTRVPVHALIVQGLWVCVLALSGSFDTLTDYAMFAAWIFYGLATASVFLFRKRLPNVPRPYRTWGYPVIPIVFILVTCYLIVNTIWTAPARSLIGLFLILLGFPLYLYWARKRRMATESNMIESTGVTQ